MSDQTQEESVSLHPHNESIQPSVVNEPTPLQQPAPQAALSLVPAPEQPVIAPTVQPVPAPQQDWPKYQAEEDETPFIAEVEDEQYENNANLPDSISWTASEYIAHKKNLSWYLTLGACVAVLTVFIFFITGGDIFSSLCVLVVGVVFGLYAGRKPQEQQYTIHENGVSIGTKTYGFNVLKSFSVMDEGPFSSIVFMPMKRFMPYISIYYDPADEDKIIEYLNAIMPMEYRKHDIIERLMHKIKF